MAEDKIFTVQKFFPDGSLSFTWQAELMRTDGKLRQVRALFNGKPGNLGRVALNTGDRFIETYYSDRWYNVFEIYSPGDPLPKVWYFNICKPAIFEPNQISWVDLALDVLIFPEGDVALLDLDEFGTLNLDIETQRRCWLAVAQVLQLAKTKKPSLEG